MTKKLKMAIINTTNCFFENFNKIDKLTEVIKE